MDRLNQRVLDSLSARVAVLEHDGKIVAVNRAWREFGSSHGLRDPAVFAEGANYLETLRRSVDAGDDSCGAVLEGVRSVLEGRQESYSTDYTCQLGSREQWYSMRVAACTNGPHGAVVTHEEITERKLSELDREAAVEFLRLANGSRDRASLVRDCLEFVARRSGCEAVGLRLKGQGDYPYFQVSGFSEEFVELERTLCVRDADGRWVLDGQGQPKLECTCGWLLSGQRLPDHPAFTSRGAFWTSKATEMREELKGDGDPRYRPRNRCVQAGYESVALIPLEANGQRVGLLQLNDRRRGYIDAGMVALWERFAGYLAVALAKFDAEDALREKEREIASLLGNLPGMAYRCRNLPDWPMVVVSEGCEALTGYRSSELVGSKPVPYGELVHPDDRVRIWAEVQKALGASRPFRLSYRIRTRGGEEKWVWEQGAGVFSPEGKLLALEGFITDVTDRHRSSEALRVSEERLRVIFEECPAAIWEIDASSAKSRIDTWRETRAEGTSPASIEGSADVLELVTSLRVLSVNHGSMALFGPVQAEADPGQVLGALFGSCPEPFRGVFEALAVGERRYRTEFGLTNLRGERLAVLMQLAVVPGHEARWSRILLMFLDLTDQRRAEEARAGLESQLRQAQKLEAIGRLAGGVAHDFNNILAVVLMNQAMLGEEAGLTEEGRLAMVEIEKGAKRAAALVRQLLQFARRQVLRMERIEIGCLLDDLHRMLVRLIGESIVLELDTESGLHWIEGDTGMIEQVVTNLVVNARDAMPRGGRILLQVRRAVLDATRPPRHPAARAGTFVCLSVIDTGLGLSEEVRQHLFEPFFTTKEVGKGTGLGLSTVYGIVEQHRGWVEVESEVGRGTTFRVWLPEVGVPVAAEVPEEVAGFRQGGGETLLVVEDEEALRSSLVRLLRRLGYRVVEARDGEEALRAWEDDGDRIDLLYTDMVMPGAVGGLELAERLRRRRPGLPVILASGYSPELWERGGAAVSGAVFLPKPASPAEMARVIRETLDRWVANGG